MRYVHTHRLKRENAELPFDLTLELIFVYGVLFFPLSHLVYIFTANKLIAWVGALGILAVIHQASRQVLDLIPFHKLMSYARFIFSADRYVIKNEKTSLPHVIDIDSKKEKKDVQFVLAESS